MKLIHIIFLVLITTSFATISVYAQGEKQFSKSIFSKEISFVRVDTTHGSQTTIIEYPDFLVAIELPFVNHGADKSTNLTQDIPKAESFLRYLKKEYNNKPVKYVLSSHWHLHSISGITPFFNQGAVLVSTRKNWEYCVKNGLFGNLDTKNFEKQVLFVEKDTKILEKTSFPISILYLDENYTNKPTNDYLFFYMPKNKSMHASCMCAMNNIDFKKRPDFVYSDRITDLEKAITSRKLDVENLFKLTQEFDKDKKVYKLPVFNKGYFSEFKQRGKPMEQIVKGFVNYELDSLVSKKDAILHNLVEKKVSAQMINSTVYRCIKQKEYAKAVQWAQILNLYHVGEADFMDTMGEAYYYAGNITMAQSISNQLAVLNPKFTNQMKVWEQNKLNSH